jgi:hypothetical protein
MLTPTRSATVHIEPSPAGRWIVRYGEDAPCASEHESATEAERAARAQVPDDEGLVLVLRDRYSRVHVVSRG